MYGILRCSDGVDDQEHCKEYVHNLAEAGRYNLKIKPEHCLRGSAGHAMVPWIIDAIQVQPSVEL
jgi:nicotinamidase-related amidase